MNSPGMRPSMTPWQWSQPKQANRSGDFIPMPFCPTGRWQRTVYSGLKRQPARRRVQSWPRADSRSFLETTRVMRKPSMSCRSKWH
ncbi:hypothetical protein FQZ97_1044660 [compost metagenome]